MKCWDQRENEIPPGFWIASSVELSNQFSIVRLEAGLGIRFLLSHHSGGGLLSAVPPEATLILQHAASLPLY